MRVLGMIFLGVVAIVAVVGLSIALDLGGLFYQKETAGIRGTSEAERQIESGASRIQLYNEFFSLCAGIQAKEAAIDALRTDKAMADPKRSAAITSNQIARQQLITDYNSRATRNYTAARFKSEKLPYRIPLTPYDTARQRTLCES